MVRIVMGVIAGFFAWAIVWFGSEKILSAIWPEWFGAHQVAFQAAIEHGGQFTADATILLMHIVLGSIVSVMSLFCPRWSPVKTDARRWSSAFCYWHLVY